MTDLLIIGAGPAGLTAAIYALRAGLRVLVLDKSAYGGQVAVTNEVENYPAIAHISGYELANQIYEQAKSLGADIRQENVTGVYLNESPKRVITDADEHTAYAVIIANGAQRRKLDVEGEDAFTGRGVSYCATCDGAFFKNKAVAVVGGGNTALEDALFLQNICSHVYLIHRRDAFRGEKLLIDAVMQADKIERITPYQVKRILGEQFVTSVEIASASDTRTLAVSGVFIAVGMEPQNQMFAEFLPLDSQGYFLVDESCTTPIPGVFVAGDSRAKPLRQIITAASDGAVAAFQAANYVNVLHGSKRKS